MWLRICSRGWKEASTSSQPSSHLLVNIAVQPFTSSLASTNAYGIFTAFVRSRFSHRAIPNGCRRWVAPNTPVYRLPTLPYSWARYISVTRHAARGGAFPFIFLYKSRKLRQHSPINSSFVSFLSFPFLSPPPHKGDWQHITFQSPYRPSGIPLLNLPPLPSSQKGTGNFLFSERPRPRVRD